MKIETRIIECSELTDETVAMLNASLPAAAVGYDFRWLSVLCEGLRQIPYCVVGYRDGKLVGALPLMFVTSPLFGKHLISMPYVNVGGVHGYDEASSIQLIDRAVELADRLDVKHLQLRHEHEISHPAINGKLSTKVHMRLDLPPTKEALLASFKSKVRSQVKKSETSGLTVHWGRHDLISDFYRVFSCNMRDLGTPVFGRSLFVSILKHFPQDAEICVLRDGSQPAAAALLIHGQQITEVPSASAIREYNKLNANMLMYWNLLKRTIQRGQQVFDFGRSTEGSNTFRFKKQWGAVPHPSCWQYYLRRGDTDDLRPDNESFAWKIKVWKRLPVWVTRMVGPSIVRGLP